MAIHAAGEQIHHDEAAEVPAIDFRFKLWGTGLEVLGGVAEQNGGFGHRPPNRADAAVGRLNDPAEDGHVTAPLAAVRGPEAEVAAEQGADKRLVERAPGFYAPAVTGDEGIGIFLK